MGRSLIGTAIYCATTPFHVAENDCCAQQILVHVNLLRLPFGIHTYIRICDITAQLSSALTLEDLALTGNDHINSMVMGTNWERVGWWKNLF